MRIQWNRCGAIVMALAFIVGSVSPLLAADGKEKKGTGSNVIPDPRDVGGESNSVVQIAHLVYARDKSSECFADHFLSRAERDSSITTSRRLHTVKLDSEEVFSFPLLIMTGEGAFVLTDGERSRLRQFIENGGFLLASAGCSSEEWNASFRAEMARVFTDAELRPLPQDHLVFHTVYDIDKLEAKHGEPKPLEGIEFNGRLGVLYSHDGLNDTSHTQGCCCCGGNEITNAEMINVNILIYSLLY